MAAPDFDTNQWYQIYVNGDKKQALMGTSLFNRGGTTGAVFFNTTNTSSNVQRWQFFPVAVNGTTVYTIRCKDGGPNGFMGTWYVEAEATDGKTRPIMMRGDIADKNVYWSFDSWGDGSWFLTNAANGTDYHLNKMGNGIMVMSPDITAPQNGQRFNFATIDKIDDDKYSSVNLVGLTSSSTSSSSRAASATVTSSATQTLPLASSSPTSSTSPMANDPSSFGLSTGVKAAIGAAVGGVVLIALVIVGLYLWKKRKQQARYTKPHEMPHETYGADHTPTTKYEMYDYGAAKYEMSSAHVVELPNYERPAEMPGHMPDTRLR